MRRYALVCQLILASLLFACATASAQPRRRMNTLQELQMRQAFMVELLARVQMQAILNHQMAISIRNCLVNTRNNSQECQVARESIITPFQQVVADARMFLLMSYRDSVFGENYFRLNTNLANLSTYKDNRWQAASPGEIQVAQRLINEWRKEASGEASRNRNIGSTGPRHNRFVQLKVREKRVHLLEEYKAILSQIVLLQPFTNTAVNPTNLRAALDTIIQNGAAEIETLKRAARYAENWLRDPASCAETVDYQSTHPSVSGDGGMAMPAPLAYCINTPPALTSLMDYRAIVDGLVTDFPEYQQISRSVTSERTARTLGIAAMIAIPTLAVCIFAPPMVAVPAGALAGGLSLLQAQNDYNQVRRREISRVINENGDVDWDALKNARLMRNVSVVLLPFFGAGRFIGPFARATAARTYLSGTVRLKRLILRRL